MALRTNDEGSQEHRKRRRVESTTDFNTEQGGRHSIFMVPGSLRKLEPDAFKPHLVSIGPCHRNEDHLKEMEKRKKQLLEHVLKQKKTSRQSLEQKMSELEQDTRNCYDNRFRKIISKDFVEMMLLDACFILELFHGYKKDGNKWEGLGQFNLRGFLPFIQRDLLMLENQLPLEVLDGMFTLAWKDITTESHDSVVDLALEFFKPIIPGIFGNLTEHQNNKPPLHLLDIVHQSLKPSEQDSETGPLICTHGDCLISYPMSLPCFSVTICAARNGERESISSASSSSSSSSDPPEIVMHSVTRLRGTGIKFVPNENSKKFTDIKYKDGILLIPRLRIDGSTKSTFLNLMAFEQCYTDCDRYITSYTSFMDGLVDSSKDAEHLIEEQIITHEMGSEEDVANLINNLRREIVFNTSDNYLFDVSQRLNDHYIQKWRTWKATLKHQYLKDPWKIISLVAASFLIILTVAQTAYTIIGYHIPKS